MENLLFQLIQTGEVDHKKILGKILKSLRESKKYTQKEVAELIGCSPQAYNYYESGKREPSIETLISFSHLYNIPVDFLIGNFPQSKKECKKQFSELKKEINLLKEKSLEDNIPIKLKLFIASLDSNTDSVRRIIKTLPDENDDNNGK